MKQIFLFVALFICIYSANSQKLLRSTYSEVYNQFKADPDVYQVTTGQAGSSSKAFVTFKNGDKYSFTFAPTNYKLYGMTLICSNDNLTTQKYNSEKERRRASIQNEGGYLYYDEQGRAIYFWISVDDLGRRMINWEAKLPWQFD